jgi:hypothetical protein
MTAAPFGQVPRYSWEDVETVYFPYSDLSVEIIEAIYQAVPDGATLGFNHDYRLAWVTVTQPGNTRSVLHAAFASVGSNLPGDPGES